MHKFVQTITIKFVTISVYNPKAAPVELQANQDASNLVLIFFKSSLAVL